MPSFSSYKNRYGKELIVESNLLESFKTMKLILSSKNVDIEMTDGWRGEQAQDQAASTGHSKATFGHSAHNYGVAFDVAPVINGELTWPADTADIWLEIGKVGEGLNLQWGLDWNQNGVPDLNDTAAKNPDGTPKWLADAPHFDIPGWRGLGYTLYAQAPPVTAGA